MKMNAGTWITIVAAIIGIAISFIAVGAASGGDGISALIVLSFSAFMFFFFFKYLIRPALNAIRLKKNGVPGTARILSVKNTGMTINNSPVINLEVEIKDPFGHRYTTSIRALVPGSDTRVYQPGMEVAVKIDPVKREIAILDEEGQGQAKAPATAKTVLKTDRELAKEETENILQTGRPGRAIVKKYTWLETYANGNDPVVELELEVIPEVYPPYIGKAKAVIPEANVHLFQPGAEVKVKYDLYDDEKIVIDQN